MLLASGALLAACSSGGASSSTNTTHPATTTPSTTAPPATTTLPLQTPKRGEFYSPSGNISCEIDNVPRVPTIYCQTLRPPRSATIKPNGSLTICTGNCLGNPGLDTPTLAYGTATGSDA
jgi:hypothetical protein